MTLMTSSIRYYYYCKDLHAFKTTFFPLVVFYNCGTIHILDINYIQYDFLHISPSPFSPSPHNTGLYVIIVIICIS
jgi:hypothetical protein